MPTTRPATCWSRSIDNTVAAFLKYRNDASSFAIEKAVEALAATYKTGRRIEFYGVGNSGIVAQDAQHKFFRLGVNTIAYSDGHMQVMSATHARARATAWWSFPTRAAPAT